MKPFPPLNYAIAYALARIVDDAQVEPKREPSHSNIDFCVSKWKLTDGDPKAQGQQVDKAKRIRGVLNWVIENDMDAGRGHRG